MVLEVFELRGKKAFDLLAERKTVRLVTAADEDVHVLGGTREEATDAAGLLRAVERAHALRSVAATERNAQSSRSHAVCRLRTHNGGLLTLVDLAGSERNDDVSQHDRTATRESADINISLQTLKEWYAAHPCSKMTQHTDGCCWPSTHTVPLALSPSPSPSP